MRARIPAVVVAVAMLLTACVAKPEPVQPSGAPFDVQAVDYPVPDGVGVVFRGWHDGEPEQGVYSVCVVNAFQTVADDADPDAARNWPDGTVWMGGQAQPGEHPIDLSSNRIRRIAVQYVQARLAECARRGFDAVTFPHLDSYLQYPDAPFGRDDTIAYTTLLVQEARELGLAVGQYGTADLLDVARTDIGFGFALVPGCGEAGECQSFTNVYDSATFIVETDSEGFDAACSAAGGEAFVVLRDPSFSSPDQPEYVYDTC